MAVGGASPPKIFRWLELPLFRQQVDSTQWQLIKIHGGVAVIIFKSQAQVLTKKGCADVNFLPIEFDAARVLNFSNKHGGRVLDWLQARGHLAPGWAVELDRTLHLQRLVRPVMIIVVHEFVEGVLLRSQVMARWLAGVALQGAVHAFMPAVLLRLARLDTLAPDSQAHPPHREFG